MTQEILSDWDAQKAASFGDDLIVAHHNLHERPMFSDDGLADLLDRYPREAFGIYTMDNERRDKTSFRRGDPGNLNGEQLMQAVNQGRLWINLRNANAHLPDYAELCDEMFDEVDSKTPGLKTIKRDCGVLISSPKARVFYHLDIPMVMLWQIKGEKNFYLYPNGEEFASDEQIESIVLRETEEEIDYEPSFDASAKHVLMQPGMVAGWPQTAPHRIDNGDCTNVSLSCEFMTFEALVHANALYTNGAMRRWWGANPSIANDGKAGKFAKAAMARGLKLFNSRNSFEKTTGPSFVVDLDAENSVRDISAA